MHNGRRKMALGHITDDVNLQGQRICLDVARTAMGSNKLNGHERAALLHAVTRASWTRERAKAAGYDLDSRCELCQLAEDTLHRRIWVCPSSQEARGRFARAWLQREARQEASCTSDFFCRGWQDHPGDRFPQPTAETRVAMVRFDGRDDHDHT